MIQGLRITSSLLNAAQIVVGLSNDTQFIVGGHFMAVDLAMDFQIILVLSKDYMHDINIRQICIM